MTGANTIPLSREYGTLPNSEFSDYDILYAILMYPNVPLYTCHFVMVTKVITVFTDCGTPVGVVLELIFINRIVEQ